MDPRQERIDAAEAAAKEIAARTDSLMGRPAADPDPVGEIETSKVLPAAVQNSDTFKKINGPVAAGSAGLAVVAFVFGNGGLSAVVSGLSAAAKGSTTVGDYLAFINAFILTLPLSICATVIVWLVLAGQVKSIGAVAMCVIGVLVVTYIAGNLGVDGPSMTEMTNAVARAGSNPIQKGFALVGEYLDYYTPIPFFGGAITGGLTGLIMFRLNPPTTTS
jgi:hypothetical protein